MTFETVGGEYKMSAFLAGRSFVSKAATLRPFAHVRPRAALACVGSAVLTSSLTTVGLAWCEGSDTPSGALARLKEAFKNPSQLPDEAAKISGEWVGQSLNFAIIF